jgi:hypothetical protein
MKGSHDDKEATPREPLQACNLTDLLEIYYNFMKKDVERIFHNSGRWHLFINIDYCSKK